MMMMSSKSSANLNVKGEDFIFLLLKKLSISRPMYIVNWKNPYGK